jgi:hypothetical protein
MTLGTHLQEWLKRNGVAIDDPLFVGAVDLAIRNELRAAQSPVSSSVSSSATISSVRSSDCERSATAASPRP